MTRSFNVNGLCYPAKHYMVDLQGRLEQAMLCFAKAIGAYD